MFIIPEKELMKLLEKKSFKNDLEKIEEILLVFQNVDFIQNNYELLTKLLNVDIERIIYSEYFWYHQYKNEYIKLNKWTVDMEQYEFKILENIGCYVNIDFEIIKGIEEGKISENYIVK